MMSRLGGETGSYPAFIAPRRVLLLMKDASERAALASALYCRYEIVETDSPDAAIDRSALGDVDAVVLDAALARDGATARAIKDAAVGAELPLLLVTDDEDAGAKLEHIGSDDLIGRPVNRAQLMRKLALLLRSRALWEELRKQKAELSYFREHARRDYVVAERVFDSMLQRGCLFLPSVQYCAMPMETFNGDLVMAAPVAPAKVRMLLGDFAGHGLSAAVGCLPISDIFYATAEKAVPLEPVLREMNTKIFSTLPRNMFLSAVMVELDVQHGRCVVWNGGVPEAFVLRHDGTIKRRIEPTKPPLGILPPEEFNDTLECFALEPNERLFIYTDGVIEATNAEGDFFGAERLEETLRKAPQSAFSTPEVISTLDEFRGGVAQRDDITFIELANDRRLGEALRRLVGAGESVLQRKEPIFSISLDPPALRLPEPLVGIQALLEMHAEVREHKTLIYAVVAELFGNALDHGLLRLDSSLKDEANGFDRYYARRQQALNALAYGRITLTLDLIATSAGRHAQIRVEDSGFGFLPPRGQSVVQSKDEYPSPRGRGLHLVKGLCTRLELLDGGRIVEATLALDIRPDPLDHSDGAAA